MTVYFGARELLPADVLRRLAFENEIDQMVYDYVVEAMPGQWMGGLFWLGRLREREDRA